MVKKMTNDPGQEREWDKAELCNFYAMEAIIVRNMTGGTGSGAYLLRLKNWISFSCFLAAASEVNVPRFRRLPVRASFFRE